MGELFSLSSIGVVRGLQTISRLTSVHFSVIKSSFMTFVAGFCPWALPYFMDAALVIV